MTGTDADAGLAGRLLRWVVRLLPAGRQEWGQAMLAELARVEAGRARRRFARDCLRASLLQPWVVGVIGFPVLGLGAIVGIVAWTTTVRYVPLRCALIALPPRSG